MIRDGLLDSERYWSCTIEARELYRHLQLLADDFGCVSLSPAFIGRRCFDSRPTSEKLAGLIMQLCDADLIRRYEDSGVVYAFIPRFRQRLQRFTLKHPKPPNVVLQGDDHAIDLFKRINANKQTATVGQQFPNRSPTHEVEVEVKRREYEEKGKSEGEGLATRSYPQAQSQKPIDTVQGKSYAQWLTDLNITIQPTWTSADAKLAVDQALASRPVD